MRVRIGGLLFVGLVLVASLLAAQLLGGRAEYTVAASGQVVTLIPYDYGLDGSDPGLQRALEGNRKRYEPPRGEPAISLEQALAEVQRVRGGHLEQAESIKARYVRFSDDVQCREVAPGDCRLLYQDMPTWVFTLDGLNIASRGPSGSPIVYSHEEHVVVNAETGEYVGGFIFR